MLRSREKGFSPSVWNEKSIRNGLDMPTEQMMSYSWLKRRKTGRYLLQDFHLLSKERLSAWREARRAFPGRNW